MGCLGPSLGIPLEIGVLGTSLCFHGVLGVSPLKLRCWEPPLEIGVLRAPCDLWGAGSVTLEIKVLSTPFLSRACWAPPVKIQVLRVCLSFPWGAGSLTLETEVGVLGAPLLPTSCWVGSLLIIWGAQGLRCPVGFPWDVCDPSLAQGMHRPLPFLNQGAVAPHSYPWGAGGTPVLLPMSPGVAVLSAGFRAPPNPPSPPSMGSQGGLWL